MRTGKEAKRRGLAALGPDSRAKGAGMVGAYVDVAVFLVVGALFVGLTLAVGRALRPHNPYREKLSPYECGMEPVGQGQVKFHIRYYLFALIFVIFDVETVFLYPWAATFHRLGAAAFAEMMLFLAVLAVGLVYAWRKRVLRWV